MIIISGGDGLIDLHAMASEKIKTKLRECVKDWNIGMSENWNIGWATLCLGVILLTGCATQSIDPDLTPMAPLPGRGRVLVYHRAGMPQEVKQSLHDIRVKHARAHENFV